jgi:hypothetical protein
VGVAGSVLVSGARILTQLDQAFWDSPPHKENVLGPFDYIGVGAFDTGTEFYVTVAFVDFDGEVAGAVEPTSSLHDARIGIWEAASQSRTISLRGWADDVDVDRVPVQIRLDGQSMPSVTSDAVGSDTMQVTDGSEAQLPILQLPYRASIPALPGRHQVCAQVDPIGFGAGSAEVCAEATVPAEWVATEGRSLAAVAPGSEFRSAVLSERPVGQVLAVGPRRSADQRSTVDIELGAPKNGLTPVLRVRHRLYELAAVPIGTVDPAGSFLRSSAQPELVLGVPASYVDASVVVVSNPAGVDELSAVLRHEDGTATAIGTFGPVWQPVVKTFDASAPILAEVRQRPGEPTRWWLLGRSSTGDWELVDDAGTRTAVDIEPQDDTQVGLFVDSPVFDGRLVAHIVVQGRVTGRGSILDVPIETNSVASDARSPRPRMRLPDIEGEDLVDIEASR